MQGAARVPFRMPVYVDGCTCGANLTNYFASAALASSSSTR